MVIDNENPEKGDYEPPSALASPNFTPTNQRSRDNSPKNLKYNNSANLSKVNMNNTLNQQSTTKMINNNIKFNLDMLSEKVEKNMNKISLQVAFTDLKMCHRFVRFFVPKNKNLSYKELNNMISDFLKYDKSIVIYRLQDDNEINLKVNNNNNFSSSMDVIFREMKNNFKLLDLNSSTKTSYSLTIVYDYNKNAKMSLLKKNIEDLKIKNNLLSNVKNKNICKINHILLYFFRRGDQFIRRRHTKFSNRKYNV
jgi:hypothetical protein